VFLNFELDQEQDCGEQLDNIDRFYRKGEFLISSRYLVPTHQKQKFDGFYSFFKYPKSKKPLKIKGLVRNSWLRGQDLNLRPSGYESQSPEVRV